MISTSTRARIRRHAPIAAAAVALLVVFGALGLPAFGESGDSSEPTSGSPLPEQARITPRPAPSEDDGDSRTTTTATTDGDAQDQPTAASAPEPEATPATAPAPTTPPPAPRNCSSFPSRGEAQTWHDTHADQYDMAPLDTDGDGVVCTAAFPEPQPEPAPAAPAAPAPAPTAGGSVWDSLAQCESGGNWSHPPVAGSYSGGLMFHHGSWQAFGGTQYASAPHLASRGAQIAVAEQILAAQGWGAWPGCSAKLGLG